MVQLKLLLYSLFIPLHLTHYFDLQEQRKGSAWVQRDILEEVEGEGDVEVEREEEGDGEVVEEGEVNVKQFEEGVEDKEEEEDESLVLTDFINNDPIVEQFQVHYILF